MGGLLVLELNELNLDVLKRMAERGRLPNLARLMAAGVVARTTVAEDYEKLEPWIQWVTAHTGKRQDQHNAFNLSDIQHSNVRQLWEVLEDQGVAAGVVSPMNARRGALRKGFFIPDPWSTSKDTYPATLEPIFQFLAERVQSHNISLERGSSKVGFVLTCLKVGVPLAALARLARAYAKTRLDRRSKWRLAAELDRFLLELTLSLRKKFGTTYSSVFMNGVAHYQHHYWTNHEPEYWRLAYPSVFEKRNPVAEVNLHPDDDPIAFGMEIYDDIVGRAIDVVGLESVMVVTGLSQIPFEGYDGDSGFYLYRPYDHDKLFDALKIRRQTVSPLMSRDAMLQFTSDTDREAALAILQSARVLGEPLFQCTEQSGSRLFCKVLFSLDAPDDCTIEAAGVATRTLRFGSFLKLITFKTGHHSPEGFLIAPARAFAGPRGSSDVVALEDLPAIVMRLMGIARHEELARALASSTRR